MRLARVVLTAKTRPKPHRAPNQLRLARVVLTAKTHSSSFTANPIACAAANANLAMWRDEPVRERIAALSTWQAEGAAMLSGVDGIVRVRQNGTILAFDVDTGDGGYLSNVAPRLLAWFREHDLLLRPLGNTVYAMPPYSITREQLARVHDGMAEAVRALR